MVTNIINGLLDILLSVFVPYNFATKENVVVLDTSSILESDTDILYEFKEESIIIVPPVVMSELYHISKKNSDLNLRQKAEYAISELNYLSKNGKVIIPSSEINLKFNGIDANDRKILSRAIRYDEFGCSVCLVTQDRKLGAMARNSGIQTKTYPF